MKFIGKVERRGQMVYTCEDKPGKAQCIAILANADEAAQLANMINLMNDRTSLRVVGLSSLDYVRDFINKKNKKVS